ncbi:MAG: pyridoxal-phosphate dependent enzyme, partial [Pseudomonadota bacterium]|nr:pyridoxal-phosphate dependent enzyme [Pseudomonadota bacterium]
AYVCELLGIAATIFVPETAQETKLQNIARFGAKIITVSGDCGVAEIQGRQAAVNQNLAFISPYNDIDIIAGQGTIAREISDELDTIDAIFVAVGGGGLISGISQYYFGKTERPKIIGCLPQNAPVFSASIAAGHAVSVPSLPTLSDATAGDIENDSITFDLCREAVDDYVHLIEDNIAEAMRFLLTQQRLVVEGAGALGVAAVMNSPSRWADQTIVLVISGGNVNESVLQRILL